MERSSFDANELESLGGLADPARYCGPIELSDWPTETLIEKLRVMKLIRLVEEKIGDMIEGGLVKCPCHLGIGQEAISVGVCHHLRESDSVFGGHRGHAPYIAQSERVYELFCEVLGRKPGCSGGHGGSQHLRAPDKGFVASVPIVGATIPMAVGAALSHKLRGEDFVGVPFFGDGSTEEGVFHESLNLAAQYDLPVLFVCENNLFSSHLDISLRQPTDTVARFAHAHKMRALIVDGNDLVAVLDTAKILLEDIRKGRGPAFLEAVTYRWRGHVGPKEDIDVGLSRRAEDLKAWKKRDPIRRLSDALIASREVESEFLDSQSKEIGNTVEIAYSKALEAEFPHPEALLSTVFSKQQK